MRAHVIESVEENGTEWGISFTNNNPEAKDYFKMPDKETAFRLQRYIGNIEGYPLGFVEIAYNSAYNTGYMDCRDKATNKIPPFERFSIDNKLQS